MRTGNALVLHNIAAALLTGGDGTYTLDGSRVEHDRGYQVGGYASTLIDPTETELQRWIAKLREDRRNSPIRDKLGFGVWEDPDSGERHFDLTLHFQNLPGAAEVAERHGEKAIWSWEHGVALPLHYPRL